MDFTNVKTALEKKGFKVSVFATAKDASEYLNKVVDGTTVGFGGSVTLNDMGLYESLSAHNEVHFHWKPEEGKTPDDIRIWAAHAEVYMLSVNALAETGEIVNIDGTANRIASSVYGHKRVFFVVGKNKLAPDFEKAVWRARNVASPLNAQRLNRKTPCAVDGKCHDCSSPERICNAMTVLWKPTTGCEMEVVLVNADLGY